MEVLPVSMPAAEIVPLPQPNPRRHKPMQRPPYGKRFSQR
jgi:hypothetical protein